MEFHFTEVCFRAQCGISHRWTRYWLGAEQGTSHQINDTYVSPDSIVLKFVSCVKHISLPCNFYVICLVHTKLVRSTFSKMMRNRVKLCANGMNVVTTVWSLFTNLMDVLWTEWTGSNGEVIPERRDWSKSWGDHPVPKLDGVTTCLKRDGRSTNGIAVLRTN